ncbi:rod shape-determining protein RodA [Candidatus Saccharibacteria bacterium]|nr:rod shape-determining protein RodA [Candidatus Saccharibacteria bacterium]MCB9834970.1 rod shape-determining protein RodA [Candidatus Nomurabacteria bacterium]
MRLLRNFKFDWLIVLPAAVLVLISISVLMASALAGSTIGVGDVIKQIIYLMIGIVFVVLLQRFDYRLVTRYHKPFYILTLILLVLVEVVGTTVFGARRWLDLGPIQIQPSEFAKLAIILSLGVYFANNYQNSRRFSFIIKSGLISLPILILVLIQPDLGTTLATLIIYIIMLASSKFPKKILLGLMIIGIVLVPAVYPYLGEYQQHRIEVFVNPDSDPQGIGYNVRQARIAIGSGGLSGQGINAGSQSQLNFLPSQHTDFIYSVIGEKLGFVGAMVVLIMELWIVTRIIWLANYSRERTATFLLLGIAGLWFFHSIINIGMNLGLAPVTGLPLPLVSLGGSSLILSLILLGIVNNIYQRKKQLEKTYAETS